MSRYFSKLLFSVLYAYLIVSLIGLPNVALATNCGDVADPVSGTTYAQGLGAFLYYNGYTYAISQSAMTGKTSLPSSFFAMDAGFTQAYLYGGSDTGTLVELIRDGKFGAAQPVSIPDSTTLKFIVSNYGKYLGDASSQAGTYVNVWKNYSSSTFTGIGGSTSVSFTNWSSNNAPAYTKLPQAVVMGKNGYWQATSTNSAKLSQIVHIPGKMDCAIDATTTTSTPTTVTSNGTNGPNQTANSTNPVAIQNVFCGYDANGSGVVGDAPGELLNCLQTTDGGQLCPLEDVLCNAATTCSNGGTPDGSGNCTTTSSYSATPNYSCSSGTLSGTNCITNSSSPATVTYSCPAGDTLSGTTCTGTATYAAAVAYSCPSGGTLSGSTCTVTTTSPANVSYTCPSGGSLSGTTCTITSTTPANVSYTCPSGGALSGTTCTVNGSYAATLTGYTCPSGGTLSGTTCTTSGSYAATLTGYTCPSGGSLSGTTCTVSGSYAASVSGYTCPSGGSLAGSTCTTSSSYAASATYSCTDSDCIVSGTTCVAISYNCTNNCSDTYCNATITGASGTCPTWASRNSSASGAKNLYGNEPIQTVFNIPGNNTMSFVGGETNSYCATTVRASYYCPSGGTLSGSTCTTTSSYTASPTYSCPSGGSLSGSTCYTSSTYTASPVYSCPSGGTLSGSTCDTTSSYTATPVYSCPSGGSLSGSTCYTSSTYTASPVYSCSSGQTLSGTNCVGTSTYTATPVYSCAAGQTLSGTTCTATSTYAATATYSCPSGGTLSGTSCTATETVQATANYTCPSGSTLSGSTCYSSSTTAAIVTYSCPNGGTLSGSTCTTTSTTQASVANYTCPGQPASGTTTAATISYNCPNGGTPSGSTCTTTGSAPANVSYSCPAGTLVGSNCVTTSTYAATMSGGAVFNVPFQASPFMYDSATGYSIIGSPITVYGVSSGSTAGLISTGDGSGVALVYTGADYGQYGAVAPNPALAFPGAAIVEVIYNCNIADGSCNNGMFYAATSPGTYGGTYSCPSGGALSGNTCTTSTTTAATPNYSCTSGTLSGSSCTTTSSYAATPVYSCPTGYNLSGTTCTWSSCKQILNDTTMVNGVPAEYCSALQCVNTTQTAGTTTDPNQQPYLQNDGKTDANGNCLGQQYIFSGKPSRCRPPGLVVGEINNCCDTGSSQVQSDSTGGVASQLGFEAVTTLSQMGEVLYGAYTAATSGVEAAGTYASNTSSLVTSAIGAAEEAVAEGGTMADAMAAGLESFASDLIASPAVVIGVVVFVAMKVLMGGGCDQGDLSTDMANASKECHYVGQFCYKSYPLIGCVQVAHGFCCYNSQLARIFAEQGRPQLTTFGPTGAWGDPSAPNCRGFTPEEFQSIDFSKIDLSEYYSVIENNMQQNLTNAQSKISSTIQNKVRVTTGN